MRHRVGTGQPRQGRRGAGGTRRQERQRDRSEDGKKLDERKWAGAVKEGHTGGGGDKAGAEPYQREEERGGAISGATFQGLAQAQGPGRGHIHGGPNTVSMALAQQHGAGRAEARVRSPWESDTPAAFQAQTQPSCMELPQGSGPVPGLGPRRSKALHLPTDQPYPQGRGPTLRPSPAASAHPNPCPTPGLSCPHSCFSWGRWAGKQLRVGKAAAVGSPMGGAVDIPNGQGGPDQALRLQAWLGKRQRPGSHQHRPFWDVSRVHGPT